MNQRVLPVVLIAVGAIWLLFMTGFVPPSLGAALTRLWPLLLIGGGLDIWIAERRPLNVPFVAWAAGLLVVLGLFWPAMPGGSSDRQVTHELFPDTESVTFTLDNGSANTTLRPADSAAALVNAAFEGQPIGSVEVSGGSNTHVRVSRPRDVFDLFSGGARWEIEVPRAVPLDLLIDGGSGRLNADLLGTRLSALALDVGSGRAIVDLPGGGAPYTVDVDGGSGALELTFAPGASVDMNLDVGSGATRLFVGEGSDLRLELSTGSGPVELDLPDSAPIRLTIDDDGSGPLSLPRFLERRSGRDDTGVWESSSLEDGGRVIDVRIEDVGSGPITIR